MLRLARRCMDVSLLQTAPCLLRRAQLAPVQDLYDRAAVKKPAIGRLEYEVQHIQTLLKNNQLQGDDGVTEQQEDPIGEARCVQRSGNSLDIKEPIAPQVHHERNPR